MGKIGFSNDQKKILIWKMVINRIKAAGNARLDLSYIIWLYGDYILNDNKYYLLPNKSVNIEKCSS